MDVGTNIVGNNQYISAFFSHFAFVRSHWFSALTKILLCLFALFYVLYLLKAVQTETTHTQKYIEAPKIGDIYFVDYKLIVEETRSTQRFRLAKLVDITGDVLTLQFGSLYYSHQKAIEQAIHYGQLRYPKYFEPKRYNHPIKDIKNMVEQGAIYKVQRPKHGKLYGNYTGPIKHQKIKVSTNTNVGKQKSNNQVYILGKRQNIQGENFLNAPQYERNLEYAFEMFTKSAQLNYPQGQVNLAEMYLNGRFVNKDFTQALFWLKQASLQSYKPAILKYVIVCGQVESCSEIAFYQSLLDAGVNIKVRQLSNKLNIKSP